VPTLNLNQPKKLFMKKFLILVLTASSFIISCNKDNNGEKIYKSDDVTVFGGKAWSTAIIKDNTPKELSFVVNDAVLNTAPAADGETGHDPANDFIIPVPAGNNFF